MFEERRLHLYVYDISGMNSHYGSRMPNTGINRAIAQWVIIEKIEL